MSIQSAQVEAETLRNDLTEVSIATDPRESMRVLPSALQGMLTLLTGKPLQGQKPWSVTPLNHLITAILSILVGIVCSTVALTYGYLWLLLLIPGWMITLHGIRDLRMKIFHQCSHDNMFGHKGIDGFIGEIISTFLLIQDFQDYRYEHVIEHHSVHHMTLRDPTVKAMLITFGFRPGMTREQLRTQLLKGIFSPVFHLRFFVSRIFSLLLPESPRRRVISIGIWITLVALVVITHSWIPFLVAWFLPLTLFFQVTNTLRLCVKHVFPQPGEKRQGKAYFSGLTYGVFVGERTPESGLPPFQHFRAWFGWWARLIFIHFPVRYLVLTADTVCHDYHHRHPKSKNWANYIFARQEDVEAGHPGWPPYQEVWSYAGAINLVFDSLRFADPNDFDVSKIEATKAHELFSAFDD